MKHDAIVEQGIPIHERVPIPEEMIPADSRVEIDAKIQAGYCKSRTHPHTTRTSPQSVVHCRHLPLVSRFKLRLTQDIHSHHRPRHVNG